MIHNILMPITSFMTNYYHRSGSFSLFTFSIAILKRLSIILLIAGTLFLVSCEEKPTFIGKDILPGSDFAAVSSVDTFSITSYTNYDYPIRTEGQSTPFIGSSYDPYFGTITSELVSQLRLESQWLNGNYRVDSVKLVLRVLNVSGSTTDLYHSVYQNNCGALGTALVCSDPDNSSVTGLTPGNTYFIRIYSYSSTVGATTRFDLCISTPPPPPDNVTCANMSPICSGSAIAFTASSGGGKIYWWGMDSRPIR